MSAPFPGCASANGCVHRADGPEPVACRCTTEPEVGANIIRMSRPEDTPEAILALLAPYTLTFHECWRKAVEDARAQFRKVGDTPPPFDPWLFAHLARWAFKRLLQERLPPGTPIHVEDKTIMSSVIVRLDDVVVRFRKSEPGEVPPPGSSTKMQGWYAQTLDGRVERHLLALWHVDDALEYTGLDLAFPSGGTAHMTITRWVVPLVEPVGVADDLPITRPRTAADGTRSAEGGDSPS